jgi:hypothetical protein
MTQIRGPRVFLLSSPRLTVLHPRVVCKGANRSPNIRMSFTVEG